MFDSHIHLDQYENIDQHIASWMIAGVSGVIAVSSDLSSSYRTLELQYKYPNFVHVAVGFHPERELPTDSDFREWEALVSSERERISAVGEVGLPHYQLNELPGTIEHYLEFFSECIAVASRHELPIALHAVHDKALMVYNVLQEYQIKNAHFHWLKAPPEVVDLIVNRGYYISVTPEVCYRNRDQVLGKNVPLSQLLIETDGPWNYNGQFRNQETSPLFLKEIISSLALIRGQAIEEILEKTIQNTIKCYRLNPFK
ncbi:TatD family hydrolase [Bacillus sp. AK128]